MSTNIKNGTTKPGDSVRECKNGGKHIRGWVEHTSWRVIKINQRGEAECSVVNYADKTFHCVMKSWIRVR